jgi:cytochrome c oxidase cbb3-type subunit 3
VSEPRDVPELPAPGQPARDGIEERDHPIPAWFNLGFAASILFAGAYLSYYAFMSDWTPEGAWRTEVADARQRSEALRAQQPQSNPYRGDRAAIAEGQQVFATICVSCHLLDGSGLVGPSLIDPYWKYGHDDPALFETVSRGRPLGMPAWETTIGSEKIWKTLAYVETLPRSDRPGLGAPDYVPPAVPPGGAPPSSPPASPPAAREP